MTAENKAPAFGEFVLLMALMMSLVALSIDGMLPALAIIGEDLGAAQASDTGMILSAVFLGLGFGQLVYGPMSDSTGRKPAVYAGFCIFIIGCLLAISADNMTVMLIGRLLQGFGLAGPRVVSTAMVRDLYQGREMAKVMSFIMVFFIMVPMVAPAIGQGVLFIGHWRLIFALFLTLGLISVSWFGMRQAETLPASRRRKFSLKGILAAFVEVVKTPVALGYTVTSGIISSLLLAYLTSAQPIFAQQYGLAEMFPLYFAAIASAIGFASFLNGRLVMRFGMQGMGLTALISLGLITLPFYLYALSCAGHPPLWSLMCYLLLAFFCIGILFGNLNAMAMEPLGHIAGTGAAVVGALSSFISVPLGTYVGRAYDGSINPLMLGLLLHTVLALMVFSFTAFKTAAPR